jgi:hypothetical protein
MGLAEAKTVKAYHRVLYYDREFYWCSIAIGNFTHPVVICQDEQYSKVGSEAGRRRRQDLRARVS